MKSQLSVFTYGDYRSFLADYLTRRRHSEKGVQTKLAKEMQCQPAYVSKVLAKRAHFSLEQAERVSHFCHHSETEKDFFILLVQQERASTNDLKKYFTNHLQQHRSKNKNLQEHMKLEKVSDLETQLRYYSHWSIVAIHVLLTIPNFKTRATISAKLNLSNAEVNAAVEFLKIKGMIEEVGVELKVGKVGLHLGADSPVIKQHHNNWRIKAMDSIAGGSNENLHYSSVVSISEKDRERFRAELIKWIANFRKEVADSKEETLSVIGIDFFNL